MQRVADVNGRYTFVGGTSYAAPHITGIVALIRQIYPGITFNAMSDLLKRHASSVGWNDACIEAQLIGDDFFQKSFLQAQQVQQQYIHCASIETALEREVCMIVADTLNLSGDQVTALSHTPLLDPIFKLDPRNAIALIDTLEHRYRFSIPDEELTIEHFFSIKSLAALVRRWSTGATTQTPDDPPVVRSQEDAYGCNNHKH